MLRILVIGTHFGATYLDAIKKNPHWQIAGIVARSKENREIPGKKYGIPTEYQYPSIDEALEKCPDIDTVVVAVPNDQHYAIASKVLDHGYHLILEKPITETWEQAVDLVHRLDAHPGKKAMVGQTLRGEPNLRIMEHYLQKNIIGRLEQMTFEARWLWVGDPTKQWRFTLPNMYLDDIGIHQFEAIRMLNGNARCRTVMGQTFTPPSYPLPHIKASAMGIFTLDNGVVINYFGSQGCRGNSIGWFGRIELFGDKGGMYRDAYGKPYVVLHDDRLKRKRKLKRVSLQLNRYEKIPYLLEDFYQAIMNNRPPITDIHDNLHTFAMLLGLKKAATEGRLVDIQKEFPF